MKGHLLFTMLVVAVLLVPATSVVAAKPATAATAAKAQAPMRTPRFRRYSIQDGLPSNSIYTTQQGPKGFIWIGTRNGLARFDGNHFQVFQHHPGKPMSLGANDTSEVLVDRQGRVWAGGEASGLNLYLPEKHGFRHWRHRKGDPHSLSANDVFAIAQTTDGTIWVGTYAGGLNRMHADEKGFTRVPLMAGKAAGDVAHSMRHTVLALMAGPHDSLWIGTLHGLFLRERSGRLQRVRFKGMTNAHATIMSISGTAAHPDVSTIFGQFRVGADLKAQRIMTSHQVMLDSAVDAHGILWTGSMHGLFVRSRMGRVQHIRAHPNWRGRLSAPRINHVMFDQHGGLWLATHGGGLLYQAAAWRHMTYFPLVGSTAGQQSAADVADVAFAGRGHLLVGGQGFFTRLDLGNGQRANLTLKSTARGVSQILRMSPTHTVVVAGETFCLLPGSRCEPLQTGHGLLTDVRIAVGDTSGRIYLAPENGQTYVLQPGSPQLHQLHVSRRTIDSDQVTQLQIHDGRLWRASHAGVSVLDASRAVFRAVQGLPRVWVQGLVFSAHGLWIATRHELQQYHDQGGAWRRVRAVTVGQGRSMPQVMSMYVDHAGNVWLLCVDGLWRFEPATGRWHDFSQDAANPETEFTTRHVVAMPDGTVYAGTARGVLGFRPDAMQVDPQPPQPLVDAVTVRRQGRKVALPVGHGPIQLHWNDRDLSVSVSAPTFVDPAHTRFRFLLHGLDTGWVGTGHRHVREFSGLGAGSYQLDAEASGPNGAWGRLQAPLRIRVEAPPWASAWAWALYVLLAAVLVWLLARLWRRRLEQRHRMALADEQRHLAEQSSAAKTRFLANLSHEIRTPMTGVLGMAELLLARPLESQDRGYVEAIERSGTILLKLVNDALDLARIEARGLELNVAPFSPRTLLEDVETLESGLAASKGLTLDVRIDDDVPAFVCGDVVRVKQVVLNLISNALKFTQDGGVSIRISRREQGVGVCVADTGPGIPEASRERLFQRFEQDDNPERSSGSGLGLAICRELVAAMGGRIELHSQPGEGSRFDVWLPLPEAAAGTAKETPREVDGAAWTVLLVEDDATVAQVIRGMLERHGHSVVHHSNGLNALTELESTPIDALVLDLNLPGMGGLDLMRVLRKHEAYAQLPIVAITARSGGNEQQQVEAAGADGFLRKPLSGRDLQAELVRVVTLRTGSEAADSTA